MTCIVGIVADGTVWMGADSASGNASTYNVHHERTPKLFQRGDLTIGFTTSWRMGQLLRWRLSIPTRAEGQDAHEWLAINFIDAVRDCLKTGGFARKENEVEHGGNFLVGYRGHLYEVGSDYQVSEPGEDCAAVGCGYEYALGAMHATATLSPRQRLEGALEAAAYYSAYVRKPWLFLPVQETVPQLLPPETP